MDNGIYRHLHIRRIINDDWCVSCSDAQCRLTGRISRFYHTASACRQGDIRLPHYHIGKLQGRNIDPADDSFRRACLYRCFQNDFCGRYRTGLRSRMRADNNGISCFKTDEGFENCSRGWVCRRNNGCHQADWFGNLFDTVGRIFFNHTAGLCTLICIIDILCRVMILDDLILHNTSACFLYRHFCKGDTLFVSRHSRLVKNLVYLLLCEGCKLSLRFTHSLHFCFQRFHAVYDCGYCCFFPFRHFSFPPVIVNFSYGYSIPHSLNNCQ